MKSHAGTELLSRGEECVLQEKNSHIVAMFQDKLQSLVRFLALNPGIPRGEPWTGEVQDMPISLNLFDIILELF